MIRLFCGYDEREAIGFHVFMHSVLQRSSEFVTFSALRSTGVPVGSNAFTYSRFLVPWLCKFKGHAIFCDASDMLMQDDIAKLDALFDPSYAVQVVKHAPYKTQHPVKYRGTSLQCPNRDYPRKNWASVMVINCEHHAWKWTLAAPIEIKTANVGTLQFDFMTPDSIGELPAQWNVLADEGHPIAGASLLHFTAGLPCFPAYAKTPGAELWRREQREMMELP